MSNGMKITSTIDQRKDNRDDNRVVNQTNHTE